jgi:uncharacterized membrane protein YbhN (UPF0104 family)
MSAGPGETRSASRRALWQWLSFLAAAAFVAWILASRWDELRQAFALTPEIFVLISLSSLATMAFNGIELQVLANVFGARIPLREGVLLGLVAYTLNYLPAKTGTMLNGLLMKARYQVKLTDFAALVWGSSIVHLWTALVTAGVAVLVTAPESGPWLALIAIPTAVVAAVLVWSRVRREGKFEDHGSFLLRMLGRAVDGVGAIFASWRLLAIDFIINVALVLLAAWRIGWSFEALSTDMTVATALVVSSVAIFAHRLSVIPGGLGFKEGGSAAGAAMVGIDSGLGLAASVIDRAVTLVWQLALGIPAILYLVRTTPGVSFSLTRLSELWSQGRDAGPSGSEEADA